MRTPPRRFLHTGVPNNDCGDGARQRDEAVVALVTPESSALAANLCPFSRLYLRLMFCGVTCTWCTRTDL
jgi:hypothetical protein